jgi:hypothetical protein
MYRGLQYSATKIGGGASEPKISSISVAQEQYL